MVSTKEDRIAKARELLLILVGETKNHFVIGYRRPSTLPKGINYDNQEWKILIQVSDRAKSSRDISIQYIFEMEAMVEKYQNQLMLAKFGG